MPTGALDLIVHPDGKTLVIRGESERGRRRGLFIVRIGIDTLPAPLLSSLGGEAQPAFSPDGRWLAYASTESGRPEVYVRPFSNVESSKMQISTDGGSVPRWNPAGGELFYISASRDLMAAAVETAPTLRVTGVQRLFTPVGFQGASNEFIYNVARDGNRLLMLDISGAAVNAGSERGVIVQNLGAELAKRIPR